MYQTIHFVGGGGIKNTLKESFLFRGFDDCTFKAALAYFDGEVSEFERGEIIYSPDSYQRKIGFVLSGECEVCRLKHDGGRVTLNTLARGGSFGIAAVFSEEDFPTIVYAKKRATVAFITREELLRLIDAFPSVSLNIIKFQNDRIAFLNKKIETFSAGSVEERLAFYLLGEHKRRGTEGFPLNRKRTSEILGVGRASLYRALNALVEAKIITFDSKNIFIVDLIGLERIAK